MINEITRALNGMSDKVDLKAEKIELAMDFSVIKKRVDSRLKELNKIDNAFMKILPKIEEAKKGYESLKGTPAFEQKQGEKYFSEYDKKAKDLGIDTKGTTFYKEYLDVMDKVGQMKDIIDNLKSRL